MTIFMRGRQYFRGSAPFQMRFFIHLSGSNFNKVLPNFFDEVIFEHQTTLVTKSRKLLVTNWAGNKLRTENALGDRPAFWILFPGFSIMVHYLGSSMATNRSRTSSSKAVLTSRNTQESLVLTQAT